MKNRHPLYIIISSVICFLIAVACSSNQIPSSGRSPIPVRRYADERGKNQGFHKNEPASIKKWTYVTVVDGNGNIKKKRFRAERQPDNYPYLPTDLRKKGVYITYYDDNGNVRQKRMKQPKRTNYYGYMPTDLRSRRPYTTRVDANGNVHKQSFKVARREVDYHYRPTDLRSRRPYVTKMDGKGNVYTEKLNQNKASNYPYMPTDLKSKRPYVTRVDENGKMHKEKIREGKVANYPYLPTDLKSKKPYVTRLDEHGRTYKEKMRTNNKEVYYPYKPNDKHSNKSYTYITQVIDGKTVRVKQSIKSNVPAEYTYTPSKVNKNAKDKKYTIVTYIDEDGKVVKKKVDKRHNLPNYDSMDGEEWGSFKPGEVDTDSTLSMAGVENVTYVDTTATIQDSIAASDLVQADTLTIDSTYEDSANPFAALEKKLKLTVESGDDVELFKTVYKWSSVPYKSGKNTEKAIDAVGFVMMVYLDRYEVTMERMNIPSLLEIKCREIDRNQLQPGDLVFFSIRNKGVVNHIGIYLKDDLFVHTTKSTGVEVRSLDEPSFREFWVSGGIFGN